MTYEVREKPPCSECDRLRAENERLRAALKPFALDNSQDLTGVQEALLDSHEWGRHCRAAFVAQDSGNR